MPCPYWPPAASVPYSTPCGPLTSDAPACSARLPGNEVVAARVVRLGPDSLNTVPLPVVPPPMVVP